MTLSGGNPSQLGLILGYPFLALICFPAINSGFCLIGKDVKRKPAAKQAFPNESDPAVFHGILESYVRNPLAVKGRKSRFRIHDARFRQTARNSCFRKPSSILSANMKMTVTRFSGDFFCDLSRKRCFFLPFNALVLAVAERRIE